ncbi:hypothetical protein M0Q97_05125 [Candidatus Dojkabacteria bacterium]|jgi:flavorubredoxin|nr:hypothetical protein [Candidatus Dojkabacteria bacterium]
MKHIKKFSEDILSNHKINNDSVTFYSISYNFKKEITLNQYICTDTDNEYVDEEKWESFDEYIDETKQNIIDEYEQKLLSIFIVDSKENLKNLAEQIQKYL